MEKEMLKFFMSTKTYLGYRRISFKRSFANSSPSSVKLLSPKSNFGIEPLNKRQNLTVNINVNSQPSQFNQER